MLFRSAFVVAIMPFVDSALTQHISPTKTPEYLAGGKNVVSTPVPDVILDYGNLVHIGQDYAGFVKHLNDCIDGKNPLDTQAVLKRLQSCSWEGIAKSMEHLILEKV